MSQYHFNSHFASYRERHLFFQQLSLVVCIVVATHLGPTDLEMMADWIFVAYGWPPIRISEWYLCVSATFIWLLNLGNSLWVLYSGLQILLMVTRLDSRWLVSWWLWSWFPFWTNCRLKDGNTAFHVARLLLLYTRGTQTLHLAI